LGPEAFFNPEIIDKDFKTPLDELVYSTIEQCPIDYKRMLYSVIFKFDSFKKRLKLYF